MILKAKHLYRVDIPHCENSKKYALIAPDCDFDTDDQSNGSGCIINCVVCISVVDDFYVNAGLWFSFGGNCIFKKPSVSDVIEMVRRLKYEGDLFRYDLKSKQIIKK
jgi:hypothetical protein